MGAWIDFKALRESLDAAAILQYYRINFKVRGEQLLAKCPLPSHEAKGDSLSFSVGIKKRAFQCFGCRQSGNLLDLAILLEGKDPKNMADVRAVAEALHEQFAAEPRRVPMQKGKVTLPPAQKVKRHDDQKQHGTELPTVVNAPLDFELKNLDAEHPDLLKLGLSKECIAHFGLGFCSKGMLAGRIAIPMHNDNGELVGYAGKITEGLREAPDALPYVFPQERERNGVKLVFDRRELVYNAAAVGGPVPHLLVVQSFEACWHCWQHGFPDVVAVLEADVSAHQVAIITELVVTTGHVWVMPHVSKAGERLAASLFDAVGQERFCKWVRLPAGGPKDCGHEKLRELLAWEVEDK